MWRRGAGGRGRAGGLRTGKVLAGGRRGAKAKAEGDQRARPRLVGWATPLAFSGFAACPCLDYSDGTIRAKLSSG